MSACFPLLHNVRGIHGSSNCKGGDGGAVLVGTANLNGSVITGTGTLPGPTVNPSSGAPTTTGNGGTTVSVPVTVAGVQFTQPSTPPQSGAGGGGGGNTGFEVAAWVAVGFLLMAAGAVAVRTGKGWPLTN